MTNDEMAAANRKVADQIKDLLTPTKIGMEWWIKTKENLFVMRYDADRGNPIWVFVTTLG